MSAAIKLTAALRSQPGERGLRVAAQVQGRGSARAVCDHSSATLVVDEPLLCGKLIGNRSEFGEIALLVAVKSPADRGIIQLEAARDAAVVEA